MACEPDYFDFLDAHEYPEGGAGVKCRRCGFAGPWGMVWGAGWRILDGEGNPHRCGPAAEDEFSAPPLNTP